MERAKYVSISDEEALDAFIVLSRTEGIIPALEPAHAIAYAIKLSKELEKSDVIVVTPDSANMISEAISVPKPVYFIDMESHSKRFKKFINTLVNSNHIRPFHKELDFFQNKKLDATQEIVDYIHELSLIHI